MSKGYRKFLKLLNKLLYIGSAAMLIAGAVLSATPKLATAGPLQQTEYVSKIEICHADGQSGNYSMPEVSVSAAEGGQCVLDSGHDGHGNDIIPAFTGPGGCSYPGKNLDLMYIWDNGCVVPPTCDDPDANNYEEVGECTYDPVCGDSDANNYVDDPKYPIDNTLCTYDPVCKDPAANNYVADPKYPADNTLCTYDPVCDDPDANNYGEVGTCTYDPVCKDPDANNYDDDERFPEDNTLCTYDPACKDPDANNYEGDEKFPEDNTLCTYDPACKDTDANNYDEAYADEKYPEDNTLCTYDPACKDTDANNYDDAYADEKYPEDNTLCTYDPVCKDPDANNYEADPKYSADNTLCTYDPVCKDPEAINYVQDEKYPADNTLCEYNVYGCKDPGAINYNPDPDVLEDNKLCRYTPPPQPDPLTLSVNYFCNGDGLMVWNVINPNDVTVNMTSYTVDGVPFDGFPVTPGSHYLTATTLGTHTVVVHFNEMATATLTWRKDVCPLPIPVTGGEPFAGGGGVLIPVTGADETGKLGMGLSFGGMSMVGLALLLSALRKMYHL